MLLFGIALECTLADFGRHVLGPVINLKAATSLAAAKRNDIYGEYLQR
jgi:hypothetical protein